MITPAGINVKIYRSDPNAVIPTRGSQFAAGHDLYACEDRMIYPGKVVLVRTGIYIDFPVTPFLLQAEVRPRSGLALNDQVTVLNSPGTIDADYRGEVKVMLINHGTLDFNVKQGMRIAQLVFVTCQVVNSWVEVDAFEELSTTHRGTDGFGSTGQ